MSCGRGACLKILALHRPVIADLCSIVVALKMNNDLERFGYLVVSIAHRASSLLTLPGSRGPFDFSGMSHGVQAMLRRSLESLVNLDAPLAKSGCDDDDRVDQIKREMHDRIRSGIQTNTSDLESLT